MTARTRATRIRPSSEAKVDEQLGVIRVTRVVSAVAAGRILNTKTAHSQIMGGVVWGIGMALHEETLFDHRFGRIMNANIAEYHLPVNADVREVQVIFVDEPDVIRQSARHKGARRDRHRRSRGCHRQRGLSRHRKTRARSADYTRQAAPCSLAHHGAASQYFSAGPAFARSDQYRWCATAPSAAHPFQMPDRSSRRGGR
jgi:hypothetical protein